jgi:hypothetical protein
VLSAPSSMASLSLRQSLKMKYCGEKLRSRLEGRHIQTNRHDGNVLSLVLARLDWNIQSTTRTETRTLDLDDNSPDALLERIRLRWIIVPR